MGKKLLFLVVFEGALGVFKLFKFFFVGDEWIWGVGFDWWVVFV